jgi:glycosyltransferase involved in cell wall biosynthesis
VYSQLNESLFEYIIVDNKSKDDSFKILKNYEKEHNNMHVLSKKCTMGTGRQLAFKESSGNYIMVIDTDTLYFPIFKDFVDIYLQRYTNVALQAILCGIFPRKIWEEIGGRRDLNIFEDVDMWVRIWKLGKMRWYPVLMGENIKDPGSQAGHDYLSQRYKKFEKIRRFARREYDLWRVRYLKGIDLESMCKENILDLKLDRMQKEWFTNLPKMSLSKWATVRRREFLRILRT